MNLLQFCMVLGLAAVALAREIPFEASDRQLACVMEGDPCQPSDRCCADEDGLPLTCGHIDVDSDEEPHCVKLSSFLIDLIG